VIERALIVTRGPLLTVADLPREISRDFTAAAASSFEVRLGASLEQTKAELFRRTIEFAGGNKSRAAEILGVSLKTLYNNLEQSRTDDAA
jgi:DNA-binding NtrC family response regulator